MAVTIATHNGSSVSREHNIRNRRVTNPQEHINPHGHYEIWRDEKARDAYRRIFGEALEKYNARQTRDDRKIKDYFAHIEKDDKKHSVYEMIIGIYGKDENGHPICPINTRKEIMRKFVDSWSSRNPNLEMIGAYYHADEPGEPHVHIDYIPVAHGYTRGLETQNGLVKALGEMGFEKKAKQRHRSSGKREKTNILIDYAEGMGWKLFIQRPERVLRIYIQIPLKHSKIRMQQYGKRNRQVRIDWKRSESWMQQKPDEISRKKLNWQPNGLWMLPMIPGN